MKLAKNIFKIIKIKFTSLPTICLLGAILIFAAAPSIIALLSDIGMNNLIQGRNPISFCNVLFVGNICASIILLVIFRNDWNKAALSKLKRKDWLGLCMLACLSGSLAPSFSFLALEYTSVSNVILAGRIEPLIFLVLSAFFLKQKLNSWSIIGLIIVFFGITVTFFLNTSETMPLFIGKGEILAILAAVTLAVSTLLSKFFLNRISLGIFTVFRTFVGSLVFFITTIILFEFPHFRDVFSPFIWQWMVVYALIIVVLGQLLWFKGIKSCSAESVSLTSSFLPVAGIIFAYLLLNEIPSIPVVIGGVMIVIGLIISQLGKLSFNIKHSSFNKDNDLDPDKQVGFKGV